MQDRGNQVEGRKRSVLTTVEGEGGTVSTPHAQQQLTATTHSVFLPLGRLADDIHFLTHVLCDSTINVVYLPYGVHRTS